MDPRILAGAVSERYSGTMKDAIPTAKPKPKRQADNTAIAGNVAEIIERELNKKPAKIKLRLRPKKRAKIPDSKAPITPPVAKIAGNHSAYAKLL